MNTKLSGGTVHELPKDLRTALLTDDDTLQLWQDLTPLARNEFICWVENAKLIETRTRRVRRTVEELHEGKRRPCCWVGCVHRTDKAMSASQKWVMSRSTSAKSL